MGISAERHFPTSIFFKQMMGQLNHYLPRKIHISREEREGKERDHRTENGEQYIAKP